tara:strand:+ start:725 stop:898 length:174 start_codon:yes stop_codon:yes gene_type:complete
MTQHKEAVEQQRQKIAKEEDNNKVTQYYYQKSETTNYRQINYANGLVVTTDLGDKDE